LVMLINKLAKILRSVIRKERKKRLRNKLIKTQESLVKLLLKTENLMEQ
jgi:hypothetical protein